MPISNRNGAGLNGHASETQPETSSRDIIGIYLREIGQVKLLTPKEERELAKRIKKGDAKARKHMIEANLRFVVKIARNYEGLGLPLLDLISEGNIGLMTAVNRFELGRGAKLSTYAAWWIKQSMVRALANQSRTIRLPLHVTGRMAKINRTARSLWNELGREPTDAELAGEIGVRTSTIVKARENSRGTISLSEPLGEDGHSIEELVADEQVVLPLMTIQKEDMYNLLRRVLSCLDTREMTILQHRFGLNGHDPETLDEVGKRFRLTRERMRQIQNQALRKIRKAIRKFETEAE